MAGSAIHCGVFPAQLESDFGMLERVTIGVDSIVAAEAALAVSLQVSLHKLTINLLVAGSAHGLVEGHVAIHVASFTGESRTIRLTLVGGKGIPISFV